MELKVSRRHISRLCRNRQTISTVKHGREVLDECICQRDANLPAKAGCDAAPHARHSVAIMDNSSGEGRPTPGPYTTLMKTTAIAD